MLLQEKIEGSAKGKFIGRSFSDIVEETKSIKTNNDNFFERASAIGFIEDGIAIDYHSSAGSLFESGKIEEAYQLIDEGYEKLRTNELKATDGVVFHDNKAIDSTTWKDLNAYGDEGHEIASHTVTHARLAVLDEVNMLYELEQSKADIQKFMGEGFTFSAEGPYGTEDERVMEYALKIYPSLRNRMPEPYIEELNRSSAVVPGTANREYVQWQRGALSSTSMETMKSWVDTSIAHSNIWLVLVFHGVEGIGWEPKTGEQLEEYFGYIKEKEEQVWVATFADVSKYIKERKETLVSSEIQNDAIALNITSDLDTKMYDVEITLKTYVPEAWESIKLESITANKSPQILNAQKDSLGNYVLYDVLPNAGELSLTEQK